jgi:hypothetical protein
MDENDTTRTPKNTAKWIKNIYEKIEKKYGKNRHKKIEKPMKKLITNGVKINPKLIFKKMQKR